MSDEFLFISRQYLNYPAIQSKSHRVFGNINMNKLCTQLKVSSQGVYVDHNLEEMTELNGAIKYIRVITYETPQVLPVRRCPLKINNESNGSVNITGDDNKNSIITMHGNEFHKRWLISNFEEHFPVLDMIFDDTWNYALSRLPSPWNQSLDHRIQQDIDLRTFCEEMRKASEGYLAYDISIPIHNYFLSEKCTVYNISISANDYYSGEPSLIYFNNKASIEITCRNSNMLVLGNRDAKIMVATPPINGIPTLNRSMNTLFEQVRNRVILLQCNRQSLCSLFTSLTVNNLELNYQPLKIEIPTLDPKLIDEIPGRIYPYHGILQNVDFGRLCRTLQKTFSHLYEMSHPPDNEYAVTYDKALHINDDIMPITQSRSCGLVLKYDQLKSIYLSPPPYVIITNSEYNLKNIIVVYACVENTCKTNAVIYIENLELFFPVMRIKPDNSVHSDLISDLGTKSYQLSGYLQRRILQDISMPLLCLTIHGASRGLYIFKDFTASDAFHINMNNKMEQASNKVIQSRDCNLQKINEPLSTISVTAVPVHAVYEPSENKIVVLSCKSRNCNLEVVLNIENFTEQFPLQKYKMKFNRTMNEKLEKLYEISLDTRHRLFQTDELNLTIFCNKLREFSNGEYEKIPNILDPPINVYQGIFDRYMRVPPTFNPINIPTRGCRLRKSKKPSKQIVLTSLPLHNNQDIIQNKLVILGCATNECTLETMLELYDLKKDLPLKTDQDSAENLPKNEFRNFSSRSFGSISGGESTSMTGVQSSGNEQTPKAGTSVATRQHGTQPVSANDPRLVSAPAEYRSLSLIAENRGFVASANPRGKSKQTDSGSGSETKN